MITTSLTEYSGMTFCKAFKGHQTSFKDQEICKFAAKARMTNTCIWMRIDGTCSSPDACNEILRKEESNE